MDNKKQKIQAPMVGGSSLLIIFAVLCLTVFALLGFSTVQADTRLSDISTAAAHDYYEAENSAEEILAELRANNLPKGVKQSGDIYSYSCEISKTQRLFVKVKINGSDFEILQWQAISVADWQNDESLTVWDGK